MTPFIKHTPVGLTIVMTVAGLLMMTSAWAGQKPTAVSIERLRSMMENPKVVILDVRQAGDWKKSRNKIKGAVRQNPRQFDTWISNYSPGNTIVLYCA